MDVKWYTKIAFESLALQDLQLADIVGMASIDLKAQETGVLASSLDFAFLSFL
jgi:hypothetical protein